MLASMPTTTQRALEAASAAWRPADYVMICLTVVIVLLTVVITFLALATWWSNRRTGQLIEQVRDYAGSTMQLTQEVRDYAQGTLTAAGENLKVAAESLAVAHASLDFYARPVVTIAKVDERPSVSLGARTHLAVCNESIQSIVIQGRDAVSVTIVREESAPASELIVVVLSQALFAVDDGQRPNDWPITLERRARFDIRFEYKLPGSIPDQDQVCVVIKVRVNYLYRDTEHTATKRFPYRLQIRGAGVHV